MRTNVTIRFLDFLKIDQDAISALLAITKSLNVRFGKPGKPLIHDQKC